MIVPRLKNTTRPTVPKPARDQIVYFSAGQHNRAVFYHRPGCRYIGQILPHNLRKTDPLTAYEKFHLWACTQCRDQALEDAARGGA